MAEPGGRPRARRGWLLAGMVVLAVAAAVAAGIGFGGRSADHAPRRTVPPATAQVTRADLVDYLDVTGRVGFGAVSTLTARASAGTITSLPAVGTELRRGQAIYAVDTRPVTLLYGALPAYRAIKAGDKGPDVRQFEENLRALGYRGFTVDESFSAATTTAVRAWQKDLQLTQTGIVQPDQIVYAAGPVRIAEHKLELGAAVSGPVLTYTGTSRAVAVDLPVDRARLAVRGRQVTVSTSSSAGTTGTVVEVGTSANAPAAGASPGADPGAPADSHGGTPTIPVSIQLSGDSGAVLPYDGAPVTVRFVADRRSGVLCVPVEALLALREGGFGVEVVDGDTSHVVAVQVGMFAEGRVELLGDAPAAGTAVGVPG